MNIASPHTSADVRRLEAALEVGNVAWWEMDCTTGAVSFHRHKTDMLGYPPEGFTHYTHFTALLHPDDLQPAMEAMSEHLRGIRPEYQLDYRIRNRAGEYRWFQDVGRVSARDEAGRPLVVTGIAMDITDRKRTEAALREGQDRFRKMFHGHSAVKLVLDPASGRITDANEAAAAFYGWSIDELTRMCIHEINVLPPEAVALAMAKAGAARQARFEFKHRRADGSVRDVEVFSNLVDMPGGACLYSIIHDISEQKRAEAALRKHERSLVHAEAFARFGHWEISLDDGVLHASEGAARIYGFDRTVSSLADVQRCAVADDRPALDAALRGLIEEHTPYDVEFRIRRVSDGEIVTVHSRAEYDEANRTVFGVVQDITARKLIEHEREALILQLQSAIEHIRTLKGIVPICSSCKKIRDDKGFWEQVDAYVTRHTEAQFSHGICPDCLRRLYPDVDLRGV
jgi:PAS domain S-box-containing protein